MKFKIYFFLLVLLAFYGCGIKREVVPRYRFEIGKEITYNMKGEADLMVDMGLFIYNSKASIGAKVVFTPIDTNEFGYKVRFDVREPVVEGLSNQFQAAYFIGLNSIRKLLSEFYIDELGRSKVLYDNLEIRYLSYGVNIFFGELTELNQNVSFSTNISGWIMKIPVISKYTEQRSLKENRGRVLVIFQKASVVSYEKEEFEKSVEPKSIGAVSYELTSNLDLIKGEIIKKDINFNVKYDIPVKQGFITTYIRIECKGNISLLNPSLEI